jgi:protein O-GlcNAc transferase
MRIIRCASAAILLTPFGWTLAVSPQSRHELSSRLEQADTAFRAGYAAMARNDLATARKDFETAVRLAPQIEEGHSALGIVLYQLGELPQAIVELEKARTTKPDDTAAVTNLALAYEQSGAPDKAIPLFRQAELQSASAKPPATLAPLELAAFARALAASGKPDEAIEKMHSAVVGDDSNAELHDALGSLFAQQKQWPQAQNEFERAVELNPNLPAAHLHLGVTLESTQQVDAAVEQLRLATQLAPNDAVAHMESGRALAMANQDDAAQSAFKRALELNPSLIDATYQLALTLQRAGDEQQAIPLFRKTIEAQPQNAAALSNLGLALVQTGNAKEAIPLFQRALARTPNDATAHQDLGVAYLQQSDLDDAVREFRTALLLIPDSSQLHYDLGLALKLKDDLPNSISELETAARLDANSPDAPYTLGILYMQAGRFDDAVANLRSALRLRPENGDGWAILGSVYKQQNNYSDATHALQEAIRLLPDQPGPHITLAGVLQEQGKQAEAAAERKKGADLTRRAVNHQRATFATNTGNMLMQKGQIADAIARYQDAVGNDPGYADAHRQLALALDRQGRTAEAEVERKKADELSAAHP